KTGDGAGIMMQIPRNFFQEELRKIGIQWVPSQPFAVGMIFFPQAFEDRECCRKILEENAICHETQVLGWRQVPIDPEVLGAQAKDNLPKIEQVFLAPLKKVPEKDFERTLFLIRKTSEKRIDEEDIRDFYIPSFSSQTLVYKGLMVAPQIKKFYLDLANPLFQSSFALFHQRFSTNTFPTWASAQPFRMLAHNGEINTIQGNRKWMRAREPELHRLSWVENAEVLKPILQAATSDSASLDNALETIVMGGRDILQAKSMMLPEAWENMPHMSPALRAYFEYHSCLMEPWDGPAAITFSDGKHVGAILDRNGLRPARYVLSNEGILILGSEVGMISLPDEKIVKRGRLGPGQMIAVDLDANRILEHDSIKENLSLNKPYQAWLDQGLWRFSTRKRPAELKAPVLEETQRQRLLIAMGYTQEEMDMVLKPMVLEGKEPTFSMGDDTPLSVLSKNARPLYSYFKQLFAQVTNPPIDPLREKLVMALNTYLGPRGNIFEESPEHAKLIQLTSPILDEIDLAALRPKSQKKFKAITLCTRFKAELGPREMEESLLSLCDAAVNAIKRGTSLIILSDRAIDPQCARIPMLLAVGAVHHYLIREGLRMRAGIIADAGDARDVHHFACLLAYGAQAICPYLSLATVQRLVETEKIKGIRVSEALANFKSAVEKGLYKIMSKMGISTLSSYQGAQ
ncbi:MAG: glutamate synthase central domain-containing protein, partial [bacterium]|nr:glutamate synthase central domain-containing protein [bacterium]